MYNVRLTSVDLTEIRECRPGGTAKPRSLTIGSSLNGCKYTYTQINAIYYSSSWRGLHTHLKQFIIILIK